MTSVIFRLALVACGTLCAASEGTQINFEFGGMLEGLGAPDHKGMDRAGISQVMNRFMRLLDDAGSYDGDISMDFFDKLDSLVTEDTMFQVCAPSTGCPAPMVGPQAILDNVFVVLGARRMNSMHALGGAVMEEGDNDDEVEISTTYSGWELTNDDMAGGGIADQIYGTWDWVLVKAPHSPHGWKISKQMVERTFTTRQAHCGDGKCTAPIEGDAWCPADCAP
mmetsp:Transcript_3951/g.4577  ORF Transcript_3951/g.4577 Transcript_3951/m.4577 type:complete len:223 (-) Transcript_3951:69-737(-)|eukprot:CAMPEP_0205821530 /NCGR_PEP_ID=MMETSP0206-20130828/8223_1 /ASSEMBLY_ACC=CAM_ASM_000279 /TAXON_ID=36767 /ORGANISM="Euplotes focardii, Strain TN1" /LENGTH=222 /DNA_ID=CAMNT_0053117065 /DNA_START=30 /DNA_END=698 /DNA_ORIENTATION=+